MTKLVSTGYRSQDRRSSYLANYRDTADYDDGFISMLSPTTNSRRANEYGNMLKQYLSDCVADTDAIAPSFLTA